MKPLFGLLAALIFLWQQLGEKPATVPAAQNSGDILAPLNAVIWQTSQDLMTAVLMAGLITLVVTVLLGRWR